MHRWSWRWPWTLWTQTTAAAKGNKLLSTLMALLLKSLIYILCECRMDETKSALLCCTACLLDRIFRCDLICFYLELSWSNMLLSVFPLEKWWTNKPYHLSKQPLTHLAMQLPFSAKVKLYVEFKIGFWSNICFNFISFSNCGGVFLLCFLPNLFWLHFDHCNTWICLLGSSYYKLWWNLICLPNLRYIL